MTERNPLFQKEQRTKQDKYIEFSRFLRRHRIARFAINTLSRTILAIAMISTPGGIELFSNPEARRFIFDKETHTGLLKDSILSESLYYPNREDTSLDFSNAPAGRWVAYDFNRPSEFSDIVRKRNRQLFKGVMFAFPLEEIMDNKPSDHTPTGLLKPFAAEHLLQLDRLPLDELIANGLMEQTTYQEAYQRVGLHEKYRRFLILAGIVESPIYRITPKGNGLIFIDSEAGDKKEYPEGEREFKPAFAT